MCVGAEVLPLKAQVLDGQLSLNEVFVPNNCFKNIIVKLDTNLELLLLSPAGSVDVSQLRYNLSVRHFVTTLFATIRKCLILLS